MDAAFLMSDRCPPLLLHDTVDDWPAMSWTPSIIAKFLADKKFQCRIGPKENEDRLWEADCVHEDVTMQEFHEWLNGEPSLTSALAPYSKDDFWAYIDYKSMKDMFQLTPDVLKSVQWGNFGLTGRDGEQSTVWIGSEGAHTPCHYDTYGFNLVAQIYGRKRWVLIPPRSTCSMYPTRLPYEESSVFSDVNFLQLNLTRHPKLKMIRPYVITLEPGQVLYVPRHWWHFVECLEPSISINTWVELPEDNESRYTESVTRTLYSLLRVGLEQSGSSDWLNPNENIFSHEVNIKQLQATYNNLHQHRSRKESSSNTFPQHGNTDETASIAHHHNRPQTEASTNTEQSNLEKFANFLTQKCKTASENVVPLNSGLTCKMFVCKENVVGDLKRNASSIDNNDAIRPAKWIRINESDKCSCNNCINHVPVAEQSQFDITVCNETIQHCDKEMFYKSNMNDLPIYKGMVHQLKPISIYDYITCVNGRKQNEDKSAAGDDRCSFEPEEKGDNKELTDKVNKTDNATNIGSILTTEIFIKSILDPQVIQSITKVLEENMK